MRNATMRALCFAEPGKIEVRKKPIPQCGPTDALVKIHAATICGTDVHIWRGEYPVQPGLTIGHEMLGEVVDVGAAVTGLGQGTRVVCGAINPCGNCYSCQSSRGAQCGNKLLGGWRFGNTLDGCQAEYVLVPNAMGNLAEVPSTLSDEEVLMCCDILSTGISGPERGRVKLGDTVAVFACGPIGFGAIVGARLLGASRIFGVSSNPARLAMAQRMGVTDVVNYKHVSDCAKAIKDMTGGEGVDVAVECLGEQTTFQGCLESLKPGGTLASLGVYHQDLTIDLLGYGYGIGDIDIVSALCPGGKDRMRRLMRLIESKRIEAKPIVSHHYRMDEIETAYDVFAHKKDGCLKVAIHMQ